MPRLSLLLSAGAVVLLGPSLVVSQTSSGAPYSNVTLDDNDPAILYLPSPSDWTTTPGSDPNFQGTIHYSNSSVGVGIVVNFTGTDIYYYGVHKPDRAVLTVFIDGQKVVGSVDGSADIDQFAKDEDKQLVLLQHYKVQDGTHSLKISNEFGDDRVGPDFGSTIPYMAVDQIVITGIVPGSAGSTGTTVVGSSSVPAPSQSAAVQQSGQSSGQSSSHGNNTQSGIIPANAPTESSGKASGLSTGALAGVITGSVFAFAGIALVAAYIARRSVAANSADGQKKWHQNPRYQNNGNNAAKGFDFADADAKSIDSYSMSGHGHLGPMATGAGAGAAAAAAARGGVGKPEMRPATQYSMSESGDGHSMGGGNGGYDRASVAPSAFSGQGGGGLGLPQSRGYNTRQSAAPSSFYSRASSIYPDERLRDSTQPPLPNNGAFDRDSRYTDGGYSERYSVMSSSTQGDMSGQGLHRRTGSGASKDILGGPEPGSIADRARGRWLYGGTP